jgi:phage terminase small subunit
MAKRLTKKEKAFAKEYINTGNGTRSALKVYDTEDINTAAVIASENLSKPKVIAYLESRAERAAERIVELSEQDEMMPVALGASKDILDRAGYKPTEKTMSLNVNVNAEPNENLTELANALLQQQRTA